MTEPDRSDRVDSALRRLGDGPRSATAWREPAAIRRIAARRRRARFAGATAGAVVVAVAVTLAVVLPGGDGLSGPATPVHVAAGQHIAAHAGAGVQLVSDAKPLHSADHDAEHAVSRAEQAFTLALLKQLNTGAAGGNGNLVVSPSSLAIALAMLQNGASGKTQREIATTLQASGLSPEQLDAGWAALTADLAAAGKGSGVTVQSANSLWLQRNLPMAPRFMQVMAQYFRTGVWQVDFAHHLGDAEASLNAWVAKQTHGKITKLFQPGTLNPSTLLVLANAVYFKGAWEHAFDAAQTRDGTFTTTSGDTVTVPFMRYDSSELPSLKTNATIFAKQTDDYVAVQLPYEGGRFAALAVMPKGESLGEFVDGLTPRSLAALTDKLSAAFEVDLRMPRFTLQQYTKLNGTLAAMGMPVAFIDRADFSAMCPTPLAVQSVAQRAYLKVDEQGTKAAAVTGGGMTALAAPAVRTITLDHPFLFLVRDTKTGAILFAAQVQNPRQ